MAADEGRLVGVERPHLLEDRVGDRELADVVQLRGELELLEGVIRQPKASPDAEAKSSDPADVLAQRRLALLKHLQEHRACGWPRAIRNWYFWAYRRWSAIRIASSAEAASSGRITQPKAVETSNPSPVSWSAPVVWSRNSSISEVATEAMAQNSSPPSR